MQKKTKNKNKTKKPYCNFFTQGNIVKGFCIKLQVIETKNT